MATQAAGDWLSLRADATSVARCGVVGTRGGSSQMGDVVRGRVLGADIGNTNVRGFSGFAESIIS